MNITTHEKCTGCGACADICPHNCITMQHDNYGFLQPLIDTNECVNCNRCINVCPQNKITDSTSIISVYKGYANNIQLPQNQKSTSGSIFPLLAHQIFEKLGGVSIGVAFDDDYLDVRHVVCENSSQVDNCRGSKYIQSHTQGIYQKISFLLKENLYVLFSGTPCQVDALYSYLGKKPNNLYTVDFVCHGVGSTKFYREYLASISNDNSFCHIGFRDKCGYYLNSKFRVFDQNENLLTEHKLYEDGFGKAFANNLIQRKSCGTCKYAVPYRVSDISLADNTLFNTEFEKQYGSSFIFINTEKGLTLLNLIKSNAIIEQLPNDLVIPKIMHFQHPAIPHINREKYLEALVHGGYKEAKKYVTDYKPQKL